jgi:uncharacterized protein (TIGR03437 family)
MVDFAALSVLFGTTLFCIRFALHSGGNVTDEFRIAAFVVGGRQYVAALLPDGQTFALPSDSVFGVTSAPAKPGQTVVMYGIGFGPVSDGVSAGTLATQLDSLMLPLQVTIGGANAQLAYAGLASTYTGLYQINVVVPQIATNPAAPITIRLGTLTSSQTLYIAVQD